MQCHAYPRAIDEKTSKGLGDTVTFRKTKDSKYLQYHQRTQGNLKKSMVWLLNFEGVRSICFNVQLLHFSGLTQIYHSFHFHRFSSQNPRGTVVCILFLIVSIRAESDGAFFKIKKDSFLSDENTLWNGMAASLLSCSQKCVRRATCKSASFMTSEGRCLLHNEKQTKLSGTLLQQEHSYYLKKVCCAVLFCFVLF